MSSRSCRARWRRPGPDSYPLSLVRGPGALSAARRLSWRLWLRPVLRPASPHGGGAGLPPVCPAGVPPRPPCRPAPPRARRSPAGSRSLSSALPRVCGLRSRLGGRSGRSPRPRARPLRCRWSSPARGARGRPGRCGVRAGGGRLRRRFASPGLSSGRVGPRAGSRRLSASRRSLFRRGGRQRRRPAGAHRRPARCRQMRTGFCQSGSECFSARTGNTIFNRPNRRRGTICSSDRCQVGANAVVGWHAHGNSGRRVMLRAVSPV